MALSLATAVAHPVAVVAQAPKAPASTARLPAAEQTLTLGAVYRQVEAANPRLAAADALARASEARIASARRPPDPQLQFALMNRNLPGFGLSDPV